MLFCPQEWRPEALLATFPELDARYCRVVFHLASGTTRSISRWFLGECWILPEPPDFSGVKYQPVDLSVIDRAISGELYADKKAKYRNVSVPFTSLRAETKAGLAEINDALGLTGSCLVQIQDPITDPCATNADVQDELLYVRFSKMSMREVTGVDDSLIWKVTIDLEELL